MRLPIVRKLSSPAEAEQPLFRERPVGRVERVQQRRGVPLEKIKRSFSGFSG